MVFLDLNLTLGMIGLNWHLVLVGFDLGRGVTVRVALFHHLGKCAGTKAYLCLFSLI